MANEEKKFPLRVDGEAHRDLSVIAQAETRSLNYLINEAIKEYVEKYKNANKDKFDKAAKELEDKI